MKRWPFIVLLLTVGCDKVRMPLLNVTPNASAPHAPVKILFVAAGQSNMVGIGEDSTPDYHSNLNVFDNYARCPTCKFTGYQRGPAYRFALDYLKKYPLDTVYVVNCAVSGTSIAQWSPGGSLYNQCLSDVAQVKTPDMTYGGLLIMQGEEDGMETTQDWAIQFTNLIQSLRAAMSAPGSFVAYGQIGSNALNASNWASIQIQQASVSLPDVFMVKTDDLPYSFTVHFTAQGYQTIADRMFNTYEN